MFALPAFSAFYFRRRLPNPVLRAPVTALGWVLAANQEPAKWVPKIAPRPFLMINAEDDESISGAAVETLYAAAREPKELLWMPGAHVQASRPEVVAGIVDRLLTRVVEEWREISAPSVVSP